MNLKIPDLCLKIEATNFSSRPCARQGLLASNFSSATDGVVEGAISTEIIPSRIGFESKFLISGHSHQLETNQIQQEIYYALIFGITETTS